MKRLEEQNGASPKALEDENLADKLEKNDALAMIISGLLVILPAALIALLIVSAAGYFFVVR